MSEMYDHWFVEIELALKNINDPFERINFLLDKKGCFASENQNREANMILPKFDTLIEKEKISMQFKNRNNKEEKENPYPRIFINAKAFELFEHWRSQVTERTKLAECSFIYWAMVRDGFIYEDIRPTEFINFLSKHYEMTLPELKQYNNCKGGGKESKYSTTKLLFKQ